ncbi:DinB family protein [bacterium]|nr:DinB family protein [bacterium]
MLRKIDDFFARFANEVEGTRKIFAALTDESLKVSAVEGHRELGGIAWHIVATYPEMMTNTGLELGAMNPETMPPTTAAEILAGYDAVVSEFKAAVKSNWTDESLETVDDMYGMKWPRGLTLGILLDHEVHHRGQMTVLMRLAGLTVPGIYGPSKDEWEKTGMPEPPY